MAWVKIDDQLFLNPKVMSVSDRAKLLYLSALCLSSAQETDGILSAQMVKSAAGIVHQPFKAKDELLAAGLWQFYSEDKFEIHDYLKYNPSSVQLRQQRQQARERKDKWRSEQRRNAVPPDVPDSGTNGSTPLPRSSDLDLSSSEPCVGPASEEDRVYAEAERRYAARSGEPVVHKKAWMRKTMDTIRLERSEAQQALLVAEARELNHAAAVIVHLQEAGYRGEALEGELRFKVGADVAKKALEANPGAGVPVEEG